MKNVTPALFALSLFASGLSAAADVGVPANFHEVENGIYRGASPGADGVAYLKSIGVKTILDLDDDKAAMKIESPAAAQNGVRWISLPMSGFWAPKTPTVDGALAAIADPSLRPIYIHCKHGQDRTGLVIGLYRVEYEYWQPAHAYQEMKALGFHPSLVFLNHYYEKRTGFED
jgi:tyrosine-protein phosphatase SIW14